VTSIGSEPSVSTVSRGNGRSAVGATMPVLNPATGQKLEEVPSLDREATLEQFSELLGDAVRLAGFRITEGKDDRAANAGQSTGSAPATSDTAPPGASGPYGLSDFEAILSKLYTPFRAPDSSQPADAGAAPKP